MEFSGRPSPVVVASRGLGSLGLALWEVFLEAVFPADCPVCAAPLPGKSPGGVCPACWSGILRLDGPGCSICALPLGPAPEPGCIASGSDLTGKSAPNSFGPGRRDASASLDPHRLCATCVTAPPPYMRAIAFAAYEGKAREILHLFKFRDQPELAGPIARLLAGRIPNLHSPCEAVVVPVPGRPMKRSLRGYSTAEAMGREIARCTGRPLLRRTLRKTRWTPDQARLDSLAARRRNLEGAFSVAPAAAAAIRGRNVMLVDDILTTGSTASECTRTLLAAGADRVLVAVFARTLRLSGSLSRSTV